MLETEATLIAKQDLAPDTRLFTFKTKENIDFKPGQFIMLNLDKNDKALTRAFSVASLPNKENTLEFCVKILPNGAVSARLDALPLQEKVFIKGPYGPFTLRSTTKEMIFIAGGTGIAPIRAMLHQLAQEKITVPIWLFYRFKNEHDFLFKEELQQLTRTLPALKLVTSVSNHNDNGNNTHEKERIQHIISNYIPSPQGKDVYLCGPPDMVKETIATLGELGFDAAHIYKEAW